MEEETEGLDYLIKQKKNRPKYARIISMEFSKSVSNENKNKKKDSSCNSASDNSDLFVPEAMAQLDSDDSEYFSAEEFILSSSSSSISTDDDESVVTALDQSSDSVFNSLQSSTNSSSFDSENQAVSSPTSSISERYRAPSKKQKRKRKKSTNTMNYFSLPFCNLEGFDLELNEIREVIVERETNVLKSVPSLVELCVSASKRLSKTTSSINVPRAISRVLKIGNSAHSFRQQQLDNLFQVLELSNKLYVFKQQGITEVSKANKLLTHPRRNIWSIDNGINTAYVYQGSKSSSYIPYYYESKLYFNYPPTTAELDFSAGNRLSALAHAVDLLLPSRLSGNKSIRQRHKSNSDAHMAEMELNVKRIQMLLSQKYPDVVNDDTFSRILPYVFWARGDIKEASQAFLTLVDNEQRVRLKAMYLYDAGRMFLQFGDSESAVRFYQLAPDALATKQKHVPHSDEINKQTRMLCAAANDVGILSIQKAEKSISAWTSAISVTIPESIQCSGSMSAFDAFLCFHAAYWHEQTGSVYEEARRRLETLIEKHKYLCYYLSMVYALSGNGEASSKMYRRFVGSITSDEPLPGQISFNNSSKAPWQPLVDKIILQGTSLTPMKVVWRVQLVPPRFSDAHHGNGNINPHEADCCSRKLNLRISGDGYLTGDMQMVLPPMRGIYLDLYTGNLHLTKIPSNTETWKCYNAIDQVQMISQYYACQVFKGTPFFLPTMTEMYRGKFGERIHMINTSINCANVTTYSLTTNPHLCHLVWTGADGQKVKINVFHRLRAWIAEALLQETSKDVTATTELKTEVKRLLHKFVSRGLTLHSVYDSIVSAAKNNLEVKSKSSTQKEQKGKKGKKGKKLKMRTPQVSVFSATGVIDYCVFNRGLALALMHDCLTKNVLVVIDATSKETFKKPKYLYVNNFHHFVKQSPMITEQSDCFCVYTSDGVGGYLTVDRHGEFIEERRSLMFLNESEQSRPVTYHSTVYGLQEDKMLLSCCNGFVNKIDYLGEIFNFGSVADILVLLTGSGEIKFVDLPSNLPLEPIFNLNKPMDTNIWSPHELKIRDDRKVQTFSIIGEANFIDENGKSYTRGAIALDNNLLIIKVNRDTFEGEAKVTITQSITLAGFPKEIHFINETVGFLVTATQHMKTNHHYRENLYHYHHDGYLKEVLMCLGQGPRSFLTVFLPENTETEFSDPDHGKEGWRVYMRDGHDAIICVLLK